MKRACLLLLVFTFLYGCALGATPFFFYGTGSAKSKIVQSPAFHITEEQTNKILENSLMMGKSWGYDVREEEREEGYILLVKKIPESGSRRLSVHVSTFFKIGPAVQVFGKVTGDETMVSSGVLDEMDKIIKMIEEVFPAE